MHRNNERLTKTRGSKNCPIRLLPADKIVDFYQWYVTTDDIRQESTYERVREAFRICTL